MSNQSSSGAIQGVLEPSVANSTNDQPPLIAISLELYTNLSEQCTRILNESRQQQELPAVYCQGLFDGWSCWKDTPAGVKANQTCPHFIQGFDSDLFSSKECMEDGTWFMLDGKRWTNYTSCVNLDALLWHQTITAVYKAGYCISLIALVISLALLSYLKSIRCARIILHMNLFASFAINNAIWLIWYRLQDYVIEYSISGKTSEIGCQVLNVILHYFLISNYIWMLCEGLYLHTVLVSAFVSESALLGALHALGWGLPVLFIIPYALLNNNTPSWTVDCWTESLESEYKWVLTVPVVISIVLNLLFLFNIVRVLLLKLRAGPHIQPNNRPSQTALQALRATLLLVPLLGLNFLVSPFRPQDKHPLIKFYDIISAVTASFQGFCVTVIFCFCNGEVISQIKRKWKFIILRPRSNSFTGTTVSYVAGEKKINVKKSSSPTNMAHINSGSHHDNHNNKVNV